MKEKMKSKIKDFFQGFGYFLLALVICITTNTFVMARGVVVGHSMDNNFYDGENFVIDKLSYHFKDPERFDVIVFDTGNQYYLIKRVIGLPSETVQIDETGAIYINGERLQEGYGKEPMVNAGRASAEIVLGEDEYFVLGDNRNNSSDSRSETIGNIHRSQIVGKVGITIDMR